MNKKSVMKKLKDKQNISFDYKDPRDKEKKELVKQKIDQDTEEFKKETDKTVSRLDVMDNTVEWMTSKFERNEDGYLTGTAILTNIGVFPYRMKDGSIIRELRPPEEVLNPESLNTLRMKPITNDHPDSIVDVENVKDFQVGSIGSEIYNDAYVISAPITIYDLETIRDIENGKLGLSCGYKAELDMTPGNWCGIEYDAIQRNIRYNHLAVVYKGRAGDMARIRLDSYDAILDNNNIKKSKKGDKSMNLKKITLDGVEYEAEKEVIQKLNEVSKNTDALNESIEKLNTALDKATADRDTFKDKLDIAEQKIKELEESTVKDEEIKALVKERIALVDTAVKLEVEVTDELANIDIKKAIIKKIFPNAELEEKSDAYIDARYDASLELSETIADIRNKQTVVESEVLTAQQSTQPVETYDSRRDEYIEQLKNAYKKEEK